MGTPIEPTEVQGGEENTPGPNPAWQDVLSVIPEQYHSQVTPHFQQWDQSAQQRIEQVNSQLGNFEAYKPFVDNNIAPEELEQGIRLMYELNTNPQAVYDALAQAHGFGQSPGSETGEEEEELPDDPRFEKIGQLDEGLQLVANIVLQEQQAKQQAQAEAELDKEIADLHKKHGDFDEGYVLSLMANDVPAEDAINAFQNLTQNILGQNPRQSAPMLIGNSGGGTGLPSQAIDPTKLDGKGTRSLVQQMLEAANRN